MRATIFLRATIASFTTTFRALFACLIGSLFLSAPGKAFGQTGTIAFSQSAYTVTNGASAATITVVLTGGNTGDIANVEYSTSDGSAKTGVDYTATSGSLLFTFPTTTRTFNVPLLNNPSAASNATVNLSITNATGAAVLGSPATAVLTIVNTNSPAPIIQFAQSEYSVDDTNTVAILTLVRSRVFTGAVSVQFTTSNGSAQEGVDYSATTGTVDFADGVITNTLEVPLLPPGPLETNRTFNVTLLNPAGGAVLGLPSAVIVTMIPTGPPVIQFTAANYSFLEHGGGATVTAIRFNSIKGTSTVAYATSDGSAVNGQDYLGTSGVLSFFAGETTKSFSFQFLEFKTFQSNKTVNVTLSDPQPFETTLGTQSTAVVTIINDSQQTITYTNTHGDVVTMTLKSGGTMQVANTDPLDLTLASTVPQSTLTFKVKKGPGSSGVIEIDQIVGDGSAGSISARNADLVGAGINLGGVLRSLQIRDILSGSAIQVGGRNTDLTRIAARNIGNGVTIDLGSRISKLQAGNIGDGDIIAASAESLSIKGNFNGQLFLSGTGAVFNTTLASLKVSGVMSNANIIIGNGRVGTVSAGSMLDSRLYVGFTPTDDSHPLSGGTFLSGNRLESVNVRGTFANSYIIAPIIIKVSLGNVVISNPVAFGVKANELLKALTVKTPAFHFNPNGSDDQTLGDFHAIK